MADYTIMEEFFNALDSMSVHDSTELKTSSSATDGFFALISYLGSSPRIADAAIVAELVSGNPKPMVMALAAHMLVAAGGVGARSLKGTSQKGVSKQVAHVSKVVSEELKGTISSASGIDKKTVSKNTAVGAMGGTLMRLRAYGLVSLITTACRADKKTKQATQMQHKSPYIDVSTFWSLP